MPTFCGQTAQEHCHFVLSCSCSPSPGGQCGLPQIPFELCHKIAHKGEELSYCVIMHPDMYMALPPSPCTMHGKRDSWAHAVSLPYLPLFFPQWELVRGRERNSGGVLLTILLVPVLVQQDLRVGGLQTYNGLTEMTDGLYWPVHVNYVHIQCVCVCI